MSPFSPANRWMWSGITTYRPTDQAVALFQTVTNWSWTEVFVSQRFLFLVQTVTQTIVG